MYTYKVVHLAVVACQIPIDIHSGHRLRIEFDTTVDVPHLVVGRGFQIWGLGFGWMQHAVWTWQGLPSTVAGALLFAFASIKIILRKEG